MNNYNYYPYNWNRNMNINPIDNGEKMNLFSPKEGFEKGNMFSNLYSEYKNYKPANLNPKTEQEKMLYDIQAVCFAAHDINLYLDLNPTDQSMIALFNDYIKKENDLIKEYESKYGPMMVGNNITEWVNKKWPWEGENV